MTKSGRKELESRNKMVSSPQHPKGWLASPTAALLKNHEFPFWDAFEHSRFTVDWRKEAIVVVSAGGLITRDREQTSKMTVASKGRLMLVDTR